MAAAFAKGWSRNSITRALLLDLYNLLRKEGFWLRLQWEPAHVHVDADADAITRPAKVEFIRSRYERFAESLAFFA